MLLIMSNGLGIECSYKFFLTADIISAAADSGVTSGNKLGKLLFCHKTLFVNCRKLYV